MLLTILSLSFIASTAIGAVDSIRLTDVRSIIFEKNRMTTGRRSLPIPQLQCVGGSGSRYADLVETVQCTNIGKSDLDVNWHCSANLPAGLSLGQTTVSCEGYNYSDDPHILRGSCGLKYTLNGRPPIELCHNSGSDSSFLGVILGVSFLIFLFLITFTWSIGTVYDYYYPYVPGRRPLYRGTGYYNPPPPPPTPGFFDGYLWGSATRWYSPCRYRVPPSPPIHKTTTSSSYAKTERR